MKFVVYLRVSTDRQGRSGLGLDAQKLAVKNHLRREDEILSEFIEVESGKKSNRPQLFAALSEAKKLNATLLIAKLDRLSRNVAFIANLLESGVEIAAADMPQANRYMFHMMSAAAEYEANAVSERTRLALAAAKRRGKLLGWSIPDRKSEQIQASLKGVESNVSRADQYAKQVLPILLQVKSQGLSLKETAKRMNMLGVKTARGGSWYASTVRNVLMREKMFTPDA